MSLRHGTTSKLNPVAPDSTNDCCCGHVQFHDTAPLIRCGKPSGPNACITPRLLWSGEEAQFRSPGAVSNAALLRPINQRDTFLTLDHQVGLA